MGKHKTPRDASPLGGGVRIVHEDADLLVVDKPSGLISARPDDRTGKTLFHLVRQYLADRAPRAGRGEQPAAWLIHRLDRDVSGLMVFAKTHEAYLSLKDQLQRRQIRRRYLAAVEGQMPLTPTGEWKWVDAFLQDAGPTRPVRVLRQPPVAPKGGRAGGSSKASGPVRAVTYYRVLAAGHGASLLAVRLETGRKHQIRAHLASIGHPVLNDRVYIRTPPAGRLALHAWELAFAHPATGQPARFASPPPPELLRLVGASADVLEREAQAAAPPPAAPPPASKRKPAPAAPAGWDHVAPWYEHLVSQRRSDYHEELILPGVLRLLAAQKGRRVLDVACGEGMLCRRLAEMGVACVGVDASEQLIEAARRLAHELPPRSRPTYLVGDARRLLEVDALAEQRGQFDAAACVLALMNIDPFEPVLRAVAELLKRGGAFTAVTLHPAFRNPGQTSWQWDAAPAAGPKGKPPAGRGGKGRPQPAPARQYRRVDGYLSPAHRSIVMNPGEAAHGKPAVTTITWHRPIQSYVAAFAEAGLLLDALEEWPSHRTSQPGPRAAEQDRARREIPMFLALRGRKV